MYEIRMIATKKEDCEYFLEVFALAHLVTAYKIRKVRGKNKFCLYIQFVDLGG